MNDKEIYKDIQKLYDKLKEKQDVDELEILFATDNEGNILKIHPSLIEELDNELD